MGAGLSESSDFIFSHILEAFGLGCLDALLQVRGIGAYDENTTLGGEGKRVWDVLGGVCLTTCNVCRMGIVIWKMWNMTNLLSDARSCHA